LLLISVAIALVSHIVFLTFLPSGWQLKQSPDYDKYYEPVAQGFGVWRRLLAGF